jgi:amidase
MISCATSPEGLPIGVQIVARPWREDVALAVASFVEEAFGGWRPPRL